MPLSQQEWLESQCPRCEGCNEYVTQGCIIQRMFYCTKCADGLKQQASESYANLPRNEQGKVIARNPKEETTHD